MGEPEQALCNPSQNQETSLDGDDGDGDDDGDDGAGDERGQGEPEQAQHNPSQNQESSLCPCSNRILQREPQNCMF